MIRGLRRAVVLCGACVAVTLALSGSASAHAVLEATEPARGSALERSPDRVVLRFSEAVEGSFGAVRVYDARGERVDTGDVQAPAANTVAISLRRGLPDGPYTAAFRIISADSHPVSGGFVFTVGRSGGANAASVADLVDQASAGPITQGAFGVARAVAYGATALLAGGALFVLAVWAGALGALAGGEESWRLASEAFRARALAVARWAALAGLLACLAAIALQGAVASGTSFWSALRPDVLGQVLGTRFGWVWALRLGCFAAVGALTWVAGARAGLPVLRRASLGAVGLAVAPVRAAPLAVCAVPLAGLCVTPALSGHAGASDDALLLVPSTVAHVGAMSAWVGGVAFLVLGLPAATRRLPTPERTRLLASTLRRFSPVALVAVAVLLLTGIVQSVVQLQSFGDLTATAFGRAILIKSGLFAGLVALGALNSRRLRPQLDRIAKGVGAAPGRTGLVLRRALLGEVALMGAAIGVTAALVSYAPSAGAAAGPFAAARDLGPARLELTVEPAAVGRNEIHLYLFDRADGSQYDKPREVTITASLPEREIGPLRLDARKTGPGHYTVRGADLVPRGRWRLDVRALVSAFDEFRASVEVPVR